MFVIDDVSALITHKVTVANVHRYITTASGNAKQVENNLNSYASFANANSAALAQAIASINTAFAYSSDTGIVQTSKSNTIVFSGRQGITTSSNPNELVITLANTGVLAGTYGGTSGSTTQIPVITVDSQGRVLTVTNTQIQVDLASTESNINLVQSNVTALTNVVSGIEQRRVANTFYTYNTHSVVSSANIVPSMNNVLSLGTANLVWSDIFVGPGSIHLGSLTLSDTGLNSLKIADSVGNFTIIDSNLASVSNTVTAISTDIGDLNSLYTTAKSNIVAAINELAGGSGANNTLQLGAYTLEEQITNNVSALGATVFSMPKADKHFAKLLINVEDLTYGQYQSSEVLLVQDGNDSRIVEYGIVFTSTSPIVNYETMFQDANVIVKATAVSSDNRIRVLKITT